MSKKYTITALEIETDSPSLTVGGSGTLMSAHIFSWNELNEIISDLRGAATKIWGQNHAENDE